MMENHWLLWQIGNPLWQMHPRWLCEYAGHNIKKIQGFRLLQLSLVATPVNSLEKCIEKFQTKPINSLSPSNFNT